MTSEEARQILRSLLAEKGIAVPEPGEKGPEAETQCLVERILSSEAFGALPEALARALTETFDAAALAAGNADAPDGDSEKN